MLAKAAIVLSLMSVALIASAQTVDAQFAENLQNIVNVDALNTFIENVQSQGIQIQGSQFESFVNSVQGVIDTPLTAGVAQSSLAAMSLQAVVDPPEVET